MSFLRPDGAHAASARDNSPVRLYVSGTTGPVTGYEPELCGWCYLEARHTEAAHAERGAPTLYRPAGGVAPPATAVAPDSPYFRALRAFLAEPEPQWVPVGQSWTPERRQAREAYVVAERQRWAASAAALPVV